MLPLHVLDLCSAPGDQKRAPEPLEQMAVSWHVGAGNQNRVLCKNSQSSNHCAQSFQPPLGTFKLTILTNCKGTKRNVSLHLIIRNKGKYFSLMYFNY